jgi:hypothetical protein
MKLGPRRLRAADTITPNVIKCLYRVEAAIRFAGFPM